MSDGPRHSATEPSSRDDGALNGNGRVCASLVAVFPKSRAVTTIFGAHAACMTGVENADLPAQMVGMASDVLTSEALAPSLDEAAGAGADVGVDSGGGGGIAGGGGSGGGRGGRGDGGGGSGGRH